MDDVDDSKYFTPKAFIFDSGLPIGLLEILIVVAFVGLVIAAWFMMHRVKIQYASRADVDGYFPRKRKRRRSRR